MITLTRSDPTTVLPLNKDLVWTDQHEWSPVVDSEERTVTGGLIVEPWARDGGRPITLQNDTEDFGLVPRSIITTLDTWAAEPGLEMVLGFHGTNYNVGFRFSSGPAVSARRIWPAAGAPAATDLMTLTLRLRTL